ncbi:MAG TPA: TIGR03619 family F420-dependent LLM class oxidoreductase [Acidimicrobiales bacterium]|nr:TIGR03619 family F420-dependent LLM class oxidoreductase [Acidimicrobiales bacterium]
MSTAGQSPPDEPGVVATPVGSAGGASPMPAPPASGRGRPGLSLALPSFAEEDPGSWEPLLALASAAERAGVERLIVSDHVVFGEHLEAYSRPELGGIAGGSQPTGPDGHWLEPLTLLAVVAGLTRRIRLSTGILLAALRRPAVLAKAAATLDVLSEGRLELGVGVGWQREEYDAAGLDFARRGRLLDETLEICQALWREPVVRLRAGPLAAGPFHAMPKPRQAGGVPIWVSGRLNAAVVRRVVRFGSGWIPWGDEARDPLPGVGILGRALEEAGRDPSSLAVRANLAVRRDDSGRIDPARTMGRVAPLLEGGITDFRLHDPALPAEPEAAGEQLAEVAAAFAAAVAAG